MSDDEDYYDEDDYFYIDDGPVAEADDLAEHTVQSPVLRDHDPSDDLTEYWSDWEYYSDDYYDETPPCRKQDVISSGVESRQTGEKRKSIATNGGRRKRRKQDSTEDVRRISSGDRAGHEDRGPKSDTPIVIWKSKDDAKIELVTHQGDGKMVALLKDWRENFGTHSHDGDIARSSTMTKGDGGQPVEIQPGMDGYKLMATRDPRATRPKTRPPSRRDFPDSNNSSSAKDQLHAT